MGCAFTQPTRFCCPKFSPLLPCPPHASQIPRCITLEKSPWTFLMPVEVGGWVLRQMKLEEADWVLVVSPDVRLAVGLLMRGPVPLNATLGVLDIGDREMDRLQRMIEPIKGSCRQQNSLKPIKWGEGNACLGRGHALTQVPPILSDTLLMLRTSAGSAHTPSRWTLRRFLNCRHSPPGTITTRHIECHVPLGHKMSKKEKKEEAEEEQQAAESAPPRSQCQAQGRQEAQDQVLWQCSAPAPSHQQPAQPQQQEAGPGGRHWPGAAGPGDGGD